ncbi:MAG: site-specific DNA-methyltransferase [Thaumarchaeota archaeon]|nr:site-specific DNA-methyltransferase [Nitrososphaerota archaeon]
MRTSKKLAIGHQKTCGCPANHLNCLTAKDWIKSQIGVWRTELDDKEFQRVFEFFYESRDVRDKQIHPAVFPVNLAKKIIGLFTHEGELVVDPFLGIGTSLVAARDLRRNAVGFDINQRYLDFIRGRLQQVPPSEGSEQLPILDDARSIDQYIEPGTIKLAFTSPPYANLLNRPRLNKSRRVRENEQYLKVEQYSQDPRDLGTLEVEEYAGEMKEIYRKILPLMKPKGHSVINVPDVWTNKVPGGRRVPVHIYVYHAMVEAGFELRNTMIWDRNNIVNRIGIFGWPSNFITMGTTFEYLLDFWRPPD